MLDCNILIQNKSTFVHFTPALDTKNETNKGHLFTLTFDTTCMNMLLGLFIDLYLNLVNENSYF